VAFGGNALDHLLPGNADVNRVEEFGGWPCPWPRLRCTRTSDQPRGSRCHPKVRIVADDRIVGAREHRACSAILRSVCFRSGKSAKTVANMPLPGENTEMWKHLAIGANSVSNSAAQRFRLPSRKCQCKGGLPVPVEFRGKLADRLVAADAVIASKCRVDVESR